MHPKHTPAMASDANDDSVGMNALDSGNKCRAVAVLGCRNLLDLAVEYPRKAHQHFRGTSWALPGAIANAIAVLAQVSRGQRDMLKHRHGHTFT